MWEERNFVFESNICRLCGCASERLSRIQDEVNTVGTMINRLVPLKIEARDQKPQQVCQECVRTLESYDSFLSMCIATDETFTNILNNLKSTQSSNKEGRNILVVEDEEIKNTNEQRNSIIVLRRTTENLPMQNQDFYLMLELNYKGVEIDPVLIKCNEDNKANDPGPDSAMQVIKDLTKDINTTDGATKKKGTPKPFKCNICNKSLSRKSNLVTHLALHSEDRPHKCSECGKNFAISTDLTLHKHIHTGLFTCTICKKCFVTKSKLERHTKSHSGVKEHICPICKKSFAEKTNMTAHMTVHTGEKPFSCDACKKSFRTQSHLNDHRKVHSSDTPFKCNICGKSFKWKSNFREHGKFHSGEKFKCPNCQCEFNLRTDYYKHRKNCRDVSKPVSCEFCSRAFVSEMLYQNHLTMIHKSKDLYQCEMCQSQFPSIFLLKTHYKSHETIKTLSEY